MRERAKFACARARVRERASKRVRCACRLGCAGVGKYMGPYGVHVSPARTQAVSDRVCRAALARLKVRALVLRR